MLYEVITGTGGALLLETGRGRGYSRGPCGPGGIGEENSYGSSTGTLLDRQRRGLPGHARPGEHRITSYNVCYTKLLRRGCARLPGDLEGSVGRRDCTLAESAQGAPRDTSPILRVSDIV